MASACSPRPATATALLALVFWLVSASAVWAGPGPTSPLRFELAPLAGAPSEALRIDRGDLTSVAPLVWVALRPALQLFEQLGLFAGGREITERRQVTSYDFEGGALLRVFRGVSVAGGYRVTGLRTEPIQFAFPDERGAGPFVSLRWHF